MNEETKQHWIKIGIVALIVFLVSYLAFYMAMQHTLRKLYNPFYEAQKMEKIMNQHTKKFERFEKEMMENPFEPKMRPMIVNLVKEPNEYKVIVDLKPLDGNDNNVQVNINGDELTIKGEMDKKIRGSEKIINFTQTYYLDEELQADKITKEKKGDKYIVTIPFKIKSIENNVNEN